MYPEPEVKMYVPLTTSASASTGAPASASVASGSASGASAVAAASAHFSGFLPRLPFSFAPSRPPSWYAFRSWDISVCVRPLTGGAR